MMINDIYNENYYNIEKYESFDILFKKKLTKMQSRSSYR